MTELDLDAAALAAMTPGPWYAHNPDDEFFQNVFCVSTSTAEPDTEEGDGSRIIAATLLQSDIKIAHESRKWEEDAEGIARMRNRWGLYVALARAVAHVTARRGAGWPEYEAVDAALAALLKGESDG